MDGRILIPSRHQPVGRERRRQRSTDHPSEKAAARAADDPALDITHQVIDHLGRIGAGLR